MRLFAADSSAPAHWLQSATRRQVHRRIEHRASPFPNQLGLKANVLEVQPTKNVLMRWVLAASQECDAEAHLAKGVGVPNLSKFRFTSNKTDLMPEMRRAKSWAV